jgi:hypothetical protein
MGTTSQMPRSIDLRYSDIAKKHAPSQNPREIWRDADAVNPAYKINITTTGAYAPELPMP